MFLFASISSKLNYFGGDIIHFDTKFETKFIKFFVRIVSANCFEKVASY